MIKQNMVDEHLQVVVYMLTPCIKTKKIILTTTYTKTN